MSGKRILWLVVALLLIAWGANTLRLSAQGPGEIEAYSGCLRVLEGAADPAFGIRTDSPVLIRCVEMWQYVKRGNTVTEEYSETHEPEQKVTEFGTERVLRNPLFPEELKGRTFCGRVAIGDSGMLLSDRLTETLGYSGYVNFERQPGKFRVSGLKDGGEALGLRPIDDETYASTDAEWPEIGDLRVTWLAVDPDELAETYTAIGVTEQGVIGDEDHPVWLFDRLTDKETVAGEYASGNRVTGIVLIAVGAAAAAICLIPVFVKKRGK